MESEMAAITLLDGGMGQELVARSGDEPTPVLALGTFLGQAQIVQVFEELV